jgi:hypothetical protein
VPKQCADVSGAFEEASCPRTLSDGHSRPLILKA